MKWFLAKIVFRIICGEGHHTAQFDEQLRLVSARDADDAYQKAMALGFAGEESFENFRQQLVRWEFVNICDLYPLSLIDGAELNSRINEVDNGSTYTELIHAKAEEIRLKQTFSLMHSIG